MSHTDSASERMWRCSKCHKWSHAQRRPSSHQRMLKDGPPGDHNRWEGDPARVVALASGYTADDILSEEEPFESQTAVDEFEEIPGHVIVRCGPFEEWSALRDRSATAKTSVVGDEEALVRGLMRDAIVGEVEEKLNFNVRAYGQAWTGEGEDTDFICEGASDAIVERLRECGYEIRRVQ